MKAISLDASTTAIGWSIWEDDNLINCGKIKPLDEKADWRDRLCSLMPQLNKIIKEYSPQCAYIEEVPLMDGKGKLTLVQLGAVGGSILTICSVHNMSATYIRPATWRKNIGLHDGTVEGKLRENLKPNSIKMANELFGLNLICTYTKGGNYNEKKSDDDISDCLLLYASTREKYNKNNKFKI